jgi:RimJ/RimL family protein N-acetyltransferase
MDVKPVTLAGRFVTLIPLQKEHYAALAEAGLDPSLWKWIPIQVRTPGEMAAYVEAALRDQERGVSLPFATTETASGKGAIGKMIGSSRFMNIDVPNRRVEIGATWIAPAWQRTAINTEAKYLMMRHAFETWGCNRVELKTDALNERSRNAILRIGAKQEGIFRKHVICHDGRVRDSVYFSVTLEEWPEVKAGLEAKLG